MLVLSSKKLNPYIKNKFKLNATKNKRVTLFIY